MNRLWLTKVKIKDWVNTTSSPHFCNYCLRLTWLTLLSSSADDEGNISLHAFPLCAATVPPPSMKPPLSRRFEAKIHLQLFLSILTAWRPPVIAPVSLPSGTQMTMRDKLRQTHTLPLLLCVCVFPLLLVMLTTCLKHLFSILLQHSAELQLFHAEKSGSSTQTSSFNPTLLFANDTTETNPVS